MAKLSMVEAQTAAEMAKLLYDFLPGTFSSVTWPDVAARFCLEDYWPGGSKLPAITQLLRGTLENQRGRFCDFMIAVVQEGIAYRIKKDNPVKREEVEQLNKLVLKIGFKIPELNDKAFLDGLAAGDEPEAPVKPKATSASNEQIDNLHRQFLDLFQETNAQKRGYAFETFLNDLFDAHNFAPRGSFRIVGEQIDGSFEWRDNTYVVEARWRAEPANTSDLLVLRGKAEKSDWTRGLFISINGFSELTSETHLIGRKANLIGMSGEDLILILEKHWTLDDALRAKLRHTGESAEVYIPLSKLGRSR